MKVAPHAQDGLGITNTPQSARRQLSCACWAFWKPTKLLQGHTKPVLSPSKGSHLNTAGDRAKPLGGAVKLEGREKPNTSPGSICLILLIVGQKYFASEQQCPLMIRRQSLARVQINSESSVLFIIPRAMICAAGLRFR